MAEKRPIHESWESFIEAHVAEKAPVAIRETLREAVLSHVERAREEIHAGRAPSAQPSAPAGGIPPHAIPHPKEKELRRLEESRQVSYLAHLALEEGIESAIHLAERIGSPYVIDELHDFIVDRLAAVIENRRKFGSR